MSELKFLILLLFTVSLFSCTKEKTSPYSYLMFPIGRTHLNDNLVILKLNGKVTEPEIINDHFGGCWIKIDVANLEKSTEITIQYLLKKHALSLYHEDLKNPEQYLKPSKYIDSDNPLLIEKANELCSGLIGNVQKADRIAGFVANHLSFSQYKDAFLDNASKTFERKNGICINHSRLTTAICRAAGIPARTVWGLIRNPETGIYDYHHQWAEILDEKGNWHQLDNTIQYIFDLNEITYLDLYYAPEQNTFMTENTDFKFVMGDVKYFDNYPAPLTGRLHYFTVVENNLPQSITVEQHYTFN